MQRTSLLCRLAIAGVLILVLVPGLPVRGDVTQKKVLDSIDRSKRFLLKAQQPDGSWRAANSDQFRVGISSLVLLALLNSGMTPQDPQIGRALKYLRTVDEPNMTYESSLMIMALATAKDGRKDINRIFSLVRKLEDSQIKTGDSSGLWSYSSGRGGPFDLGGDRSNGQFAILGLKEAQDAGVPVSIETWRRARDHWKLHQNFDGGWAYSGLGGQGSTGSMTVAGIATMTITEAMVRIGEKELNADGTPNCCGPSEPDKAVEDGLRWLGKNFAVGHNPGSNTWLLYYLYGLERAGRLSGRRFFGDRQDKHDWYREGADFLINKRQMQLDGQMPGVGAMEQDPVIGTSLALLFLSKGLAPVLINKLEHGPINGTGRNANGNDWNKHRNDVRNLTQYISGLEKWPKLITWQTVELRKASVADLAQAPIVLFSGEKSPQFTPVEISTLKEYVAQGGFIFAESCCKSEDFDRGFRELIKQMYPGGETKLKQLPADHPLYRSEYTIDPSTVELWGVDVGCRTSIIYSPHDFSCLWDKWTSFELPNRSPELVRMITKATKVGVNVVAYATGRELLDKLHQQELVASPVEQDPVERGFLQIAKLRHTGGWDSAPQALRNLLLALNKAVGTAASSKVRDLAASDDKIFRYPMLYIHGRNTFQLTTQEQDNLRTYLNRNGALFADSCCGSPQFDQSFRELMKKLFPNNPLKRIPPEHVMFTTDIGHDIREVKRREPEVNKPDAALNSTVQTVKPHLEGIEINGKYVVIYSKYDISCALERQSTVACSGYVHEDAVKIALNVVQYLLLE